MKGKIHLSYNLALWITLVVDCNLWQRYHLFTYESGKVIKKNCQGAVTSFDHQMADKIPSCQFHLYFCLVYLFSVLLYDHRGPLIHSNIHHVNRQRDEIQFISNYLIKVYFKDLNRTAQRSTNPGKPEPSCNKAKRTFHLPLRLVAKVTHPSAHFLVTLAGSTRWRGGTCVGGCGWLNALSSGSVVI